jgi:hypothetical protein
MMFAGSAEVVDKIVDSCTPKILSAKIATT